MFHLDTIRYLPNRVYLFLKNANFFQNYLQIIFHLIYFFCDSFRPGGILYFDLKSSKLNCSGCFKPRKLNKNQLCFECISCTGKESFSSISSAEASLRWRVRIQSSNSPIQDTRYLTAYNCIFCKKYHLGHSEFTKQSKQKGEIYG